MQKAPELPPPTSSELEALTVLWRNTDDVGAYKPMRLSEIHAAICERRKEHHEPLPALTTVSSVLRGALVRGLLREMRLSRGGEAEKIEPVAVRSTLHATRSPMTAYAPACEPNHALLPLFRILTEACPPGKRVDLLLELTEQSLRRAAQEAEGLSDVRTLCKTFEALGELLMTQGRYAEAEEWLNRAVVEAGRFSDVQTRCNAFDALGNVLIAQAKFAEAEEWLSRAVEEAGRLSDMKTRCNAFRSFGTAMAAQGKKAEAEKWLRRASKEAKGVSTT